MSVACRVAGEAPLVTTWLILIFFTPASAISIGPLPGHGPSITAGALGVADERVAAVALGLAAGAALAGAAGVAAMVAGGRRLVVLA